MRKGYTEVLIKEKELEEQINILTKNKQLAEEKINELKAKKNALGYDKGDGEKRSKLQDEIDKIEEDLEKYTKELAFTEMSQGFLLLQQTSIELMWKSIAVAEEKAANSAETGEEALEKLASNTKEKMTEIIESYQQAKEAARESLDSQYDFYEKIELKSGISTATIIENLKQQEEVFNSYNANLDQLKDLGIDTSFLQELSDGSAQSMGQVNALIKELEGLSEVDAAQRIAELNQEWKKYGEAKDSVSETMGQINSNLDEELTKMEKSMQESVEKMNMEDEAKEAAKSMISGYIKGINDMRDEAVDAATIIATATSNALNPPKFNSGTEILGSVSLEHDANGTTDSADVFIAGEEGPELIVGAGGSEVFPADHTERIINAINGKPLQTEVPEYFQVSGEQRNYNYNETKSEKKISIEINGSGSVNMGGSADKESAVNFLCENIKPVLMNLLKTEIYEEGEASYGY